MSREEARDILLRGLQRRGLSAPDTAPPATTPVEAARLGFEICVVHNAVSFANHGSEPQEAVKLGLVMCADDMRRLKSIWVDHLTRGYPTPPDPAEVERQFSEYVASYCGTVETVMHRHLADQRR